MFPDGTANASDVAWNVSLADLVDYKIGESEIVAEAPLLLSGVLTLLCLATVFGNGLVLCAVVREPHLHTATNYFVASLATADLVVGTVVMPPCAVLEAGGGRWPFGRDACDAWRSVDVLASTASILNLCVISLDRYWAIAHSVAYPSRMTAARAAALIALVWLCSALISFPAIAWWRAVAAGPPPEERCLFTDDPGYLIFSSIVSFYAPLVVMLCTYCRIYRAAALQKRSLELGTKQVCAGITLRIHRGVSPPGARGGRPKSFSLGRKIGRLARERKAAKTLGIVMGVFILCWLPFFVANVLAGLGCAVPSKPLLSVVTWLGWSNSAMNPVIYALWSRDFRRAFADLLCSCCPRRRTRARRSRFRHDFTYPHLRAPRTEDAAL